MSVMGVKLGTKTWSDNREPGPEAFKSSNSLTPEEQKILGEKDIGAVANKIADPNWVDPSKKIRTTGNDKLDKDAFFKLMMAQLKQQDPSNPLKSHEMAAQLAQFSGLEQMTNMNQTLSEMKNAQKPAENFQSLNLIGKAVAGDSSKFSRSQFDKEHDFKFNLNADAATATVKVKNSDGDVVRTYNLKNLKAGESKITWNGENENGQKVRSGEFQFSIEAYDANERKMSVDTTFSGLISGVTFTPTGPILQVGKQSIRLQDVSQITDPSLMKNDQKSVQDLNSQVKVSDTKSEPKLATASTEEEPAKGNLMNNVSLSREMMDKLQGEMNKAGAANKKDAVKL